MRWILSIYNRSIRRPDDFVNYLFLQRGKPFLFQEKAIHFLCSMLSSVLERNLMTFPFKLYPTNPTQTFYDQARTVHVTTIASHLGLKLSQDKRSATPCPCCGHIVRSASKHDKRPPIGFRCDGLGWECQHCHQKGDGIDLASYVLQGSKHSLLSRDQQTDVRSWYESRGLVNSQGNRTHTPNYITSQKASFDVSRTTALNPTENRVLEYPPSEQVKMLFHHSKPITEDLECKEYLQSRGIQPNSVEELNLARVLPKDTSMLSWTQARMKPWTDGWRMILPAFDHCGEIKSLKARWICKTTPPSGTKSTSPRGYNISELLLANNTAQTILKTGQAPSTWDTEKNQSIWIVEGDTDFLGMSTRLHTTGKTNIAVFGIWAGSFSHTLATRFPLHERTRIILATDPDETGSKYALHISTLLLQRGFQAHQIERWIP